MNVPYEGATSGVKAREEINKILDSFGCDSIAWMDKKREGTVYLGFEWKGKRFQLKASASGWAAMYLRSNPWNSRRKLNRSDYEQKALEQGVIAINSVLRDWVKGQITAIETGILSFQTVFMPHMLTHEGKTLAESEEIQKLLGND